MNKFDNRYIYIYSYLYLYFYLYIKGSYIYIYIYFFFLEERVWSPQNVIRGLVKRAQLLGNVHNISETCTFRILENTGWERGNTLYPFTCYIYIYIPFFFYLTCFHQLPACWVRTLLLLPPGLSQEGEGTICVETRRLGSCCPLFGGWNCLWTVSSIVSFQRYQLWRGISLWTWGSLDPYLLVRGLYNLYKFV